MTYVYIVSTPGGGHLVPGYTNDIVKTVAFYRGLPTLNPDAVLKLVYIEIHNTKIPAYDNFLSYSENPKEAILDHIKQQNPELVELVPGQHFEI